MTQAAHTGNMRADNSNLASVVNGDILRRAVLVALVMGSILTLANQSAALFGSEEFENLSLALGFMTPLVVVTISHLLFDGAPRTMTRSAADPRTGQRISALPIVTRRDPIVTPAPAV